MPPLPPGGQCYYKLSTARAPVSREWTRVVVNGPGPGGRYYHTVTMIRSELFVFGGVIGGKLLNDVGIGFELPYVACRCSVPF
jgi:hypothetical protein